MTNQTSPARRRLVDWQYAPWVVVYGFKNYEFLTDGEADGYRKALSQGQKFVAYSDGRVLITNGRLTQRKEFFQSQESLYTSTKQQDRISFVDELSTLRSQDHKKLT